MSGTLVGTVGRLGPAGSLFLPMQSQGLSTWSLQQGSWTSHMAAQGSKINGSKRQEVKLPVSYTLGPEIGTVLLLAYPISHISHRALPESKGGAQIPPVHVKSGK